MQDLHTSQKKIIIFIEENFLIRLNFGQNTQTKFNLKTEDKNKMENQNDIKNQEKTEKPELTKDMLVSTLVAFYPELTEPLMLMGMHCQVVPEMAGKMISTLLPSMETELIIPGRLQKGMAATQDSGLGLSMQMGVSVTS